MEMYKGAKLKKSEEKEKQKEESEVKVLLKKLVM